MKKNNSQIFKFFSDFFPLLIFFIIYKFTTNDPLIKATIGLVISTFFILILNFLLIKKLALIPLLSALVLVLFGSLTIVFNNDIFIKIKPTLLNLLFATILLFAYFKKEPLLKNLLGSSTEIRDEIWVELSKRWGIFFIFLAILNEIVWRNFSTSLWVQFKVFGILPISLIFTLLQTPYLLSQKHK